jgi:hypothetical protein
MAGVFGGEGGALGRLHFPGNAQDGRLPDLEMEVGGFSLDD